jgi:hypothetical protein
LTWLMELLLFTFEGYFRCEYKKNVHIVYCRKSQHREKNLYVLCPDVTYFA